MPDTSSSLLEHLRHDPAPEHWNRFVDLYAPVVQQWAARNGLQEADAADLIQEVFALLLEKLPDFEYNPSLRFRGWVKQVIVNVWRAQSRKRRGIQFPDSMDPAIADPAEQFWRKIRPGRRNDVYSEIRVGGLPGGISVLGTEMIRCRHYQLVPIGKR